MFLCVSVFSVDCDIVCFVFDQPAYKTFDYVLVAHLVDHEKDHKAQKRKAFIEQLEKKHIFVTVSLLL